MPPVGPPPPSGPTPPSGVVTPPALARRLGLADAVLLGVGSMLGAGVFAVLAPAAAAAGGLLMIGLLVAAVVAYANAMSTAQLAAVMPTSGGAYRYGRERLGAWPGFAAGWCFVVGKTASCAAMATTFAAYAVPGAQRPAAVAAVVVLVAVNTRGITRTAGLTRVLVTVTSLVLVVVVAVGLAWLVAEPGTGDGPVSCPSGGCGAGVVGVLQSAGLLFFALAGYARVATLGEEVRRPHVVIPRAVRIALGTVVAIYGAVALVALAVLGPDRLASSAVPLLDVAAAAGAPGAGWWVRVGATAACLGALLGLVAGVGRTAFAMAQDGELPRGLAAVHPRYRVPHRAEWAVGGVVVVLVLVADLATLVALSSFGVLLYYAVANAAAFGQTGEDRRTPRAVQVVGLAGCGLLALTLPGHAVVAGLAVLATGLLGRATRLALARRSGRQPA